MFWCLLTLARTAYLVLAYSLVGVGTSRHEWQVAPPTVGPSQGTGNA